MRKIDLATRTVTTVAGSLNTTTQGRSDPPYNHGYDDGVGTLATFFHPYGVALNAAGTFALVVSG